MTLFSVGPLIFVAGGRTTDGSPTTTVEIIDLGNPKFRCNNFPPLPSPIASATGGLVAAPGSTLKPLVCGAQRGTFEGECYLFDGLKWKYQADLAAETGFMNPVKSPFGDDGLFIVGGISKDYGRMSIAQYFDGKNWIIVEPEFPKKIASHCSLNLDPTSVLVTGGYTGGPVGGSYLFNASSGNYWTKGFLLIQYFIHYLSHKHINHHYNRKILTWIFFYLLPKPALTSMFAS